MDGGGIIHFDLLLKLLYALQESYDIPVDEAYEVLLWELRSCNFRIKPKSELTRYFKYINIKPILFQVQDA